MTETTTKPDDSPGPARVLCVDDNAEVNAALRSLLDGARYSCVGSLGSAEELLTRGPDFKPDLVLLDLGMPGPDPISVLPLFLELVPRARVLVLSGRCSRDLVDRATDAGAWGYIAKDDGLNEIVRCLRQVAAGMIAWSESVLELYGMAPAEPPVPVTLPCRPPVRRG